MGSEFKGAPGSSSKLSSGVTVGERLLLSEVAVSGTVVGDTATAERGVHNSCEMISIYEMYCL